MILKNVYESPELRLIVINKQDVITSSFISQEEFDDTASWNKAWDNI